MVRACRPGKQWQVFFPADRPPPNGTTPFRTGTADDGGDIGASLQPALRAGLHQRLRDRPGRQHQRYFPVPHALRLGPPLEPPQRPKPRPLASPRSTTAQRFAALVRRATTVAHTQPPASGSLWVTAGAENESVTYPVRVVLGWPEAHRGDGYTRRPDVPVGWPSVWSGGIIAVGMVERESVPRDGVEAWSGPASWKRSGVASRRLGTWMRGVSCWSAARRGSARRRCSVPFVLGAGAEAEFFWGACDPLFTPRPLGPLCEIAEQAGGPRSGRGRRGVKAV